MQGETDALAKKLPEGLQEIATSGVRARARLQQQLLRLARTHIHLCPYLLYASSHRISLPRAQTEIHAELQAFAADRPELFKAVLAKMTEVRARAR